MSAVGGRVRNPRRERGGCMVKLVGLLVVLAAVGALAWMLFLPAVIVGQIRERTGFKVSVTGLSCNAFTGQLAIRGLLLKNPSSFPVSDFVDLRNFSAMADVWTLWDDRLVLDDLTLDVRKITLVRRADGRSNADVFSQNLFGGPMQTTVPPGAVTSPPTGATAAPQSRKFLLRRFALRFDSLVVADYSSGKAVVEESVLRLDQHYENVTEAKQLLVPEVLRRLAAANLRPVLGRLVPGDFGKALGETAREASVRGGDMLNDAGKQTTELFKGLRERLEESKKP
jgi:uncharacterized protein involved in outer membrane biogenesis